MIFCEIMTFDPLSVKCSRDNHLELSSILTYFVLTYSQFEREIVKTNDWFKSCQLVYNKKYFPPYWYKNLSFPWQNDGKEYDAVDSL